MKLFIIETQETKALTLPCPKTGVNWAADFVNGRDIVDMQDADGFDVQAMSAEAFAWWENIIGRENALNDRIAELSENHDRSEIEAIVSQFAGLYDLEDVHARINAALDTEYPSLDVVKAAIAQQSARVEREIVDCLRRGTLTLDLVKTFIEIDFLQENDACDRFKNVPETAELRGDACNDLIEKFSEPLAHSLMVDDAHCLDRVVEIINDDLSNLGSNQVAGYYAYQGALQNAKINGLDFGGTQDELDVHFDCLTDGGATFDLSEAMACALRYSAEHIAKELQEEQAEKSELFRQAQESGYVEVRSGVYLNSMAYIQAEQAGWDSSDEAKGFDFSTSDFWITTDDGQPPVPVDANSQF